MPSTFSLNFKPVLALVCGVIFLSALFAFWDVRKAGFVSYDDTVYVTQVPEISKGLSAEGIKWALTSTDIFWIPATRLSYLLDYQIAGLEASQFHTTNLFLHCANAVLVFCLFYRTTRKIWTSALVALVFSLHPLRVESVAWIAERRDVLSTFFALLSLLAYVAYAARPTWWRYGLVCLALAFALMSKPMMVTLPCLFLLLDYWPLERFSVFEQTPERPPRFGVRKLATLIGEKLPLLCMAGIVSLLTIRAQAAAGTRLSLEQIPLGPRIITAISNYCEYMAKSVWPTKLAVLYPHPYYPPPGAGIPMTRCLACLAVLCVMSIVVTLSMRRARFLFTGWWWFFGTLVPVIGIVQVGTQSIADRYTYFPSIGLGLLLVYGLDALAGKSRLLLSVIISSEVLCLFVLVALTRLQVPCWQNSVTLFEQAVVATDTSVEMRYNLGCEYLRLGRWQEAQVQFERALDLYPKHLQSMLNLAVVYEKRGLLGDATRQLEKAVELNPNYSKAYLNLGVLYRRQGDLPRAVRMYQRAIEISPDYAGAYYNLGCVYEILDRRSDAMVAFENAVRVAPNFKPAIGKLKELQSRGSASGQSPLGSKSGSQ